MLSIVNVIGIKKAAEADFGLVVIKLLILAAFIVAAFLFAAHSGVLSTSNFTVTKSQGTIGAIFMASIAVFFAYSGKQSVATLTPKIKGKGKGAAKAIIYAVIISIVFYVLIVAALIAAVPASKFTIAADPLAFALRYINAPYPLLLLVGIGALVATASAALATILSASRSLYQISADKLLPRFLRSYNKNKDVAINGVIISAVIAVVMLFSGNIYVMAAISNFGLLFSYLIASFAIIHFRRVHKEPNTKTGFKMPLYPYLPIIAIVLLVVFILVMPNESLVIGLIMIIMLLVIYYFLREFREKKIVKVELFK
jgi:APA family basic amino acid/polyamine antiporter